MNDIELSIVMPCLNEADTVAACVAEARAFLDAAGVTGEVLVADNGSADNSRALAEAAGARVIEVPERGYGGALMGGFRAARGRFVVMGDADLSYDFGHLGPFVTALRGGADLVVGDRFAGGIAPGAMPALHRYLGNPVLSGIGRLFFGSGVRDFHCGLRGFRRDALLALELRTTGMEFASEMIIRAALGGLRIAEVPTTLRKDGRSHPPHLRTWRDGWRHLRFMLLFAPDWVFLYPGLVLFAGALTWLGVTAGRPVSIPAGLSRVWLAGLVALAGFQVFLFGVMGRIFRVTEGFSAPGPVLSGFFRLVTLEVGMAAGLLLSFAGGAAVAAAFQGGLMPMGVQPGRALVAGVVLVTVGVQIVFSSLFLSLLGLRRR